MHFPGEFRRSLILLLVTASSALGCAGDTTGVDDPDPDPDPLPPSSLVATSPTSTGREVATAGLVTVRVTNSAGVGVADVAVTFAVVAGGGSVTSPSSITDASGDASVEWTLGTGVGSNQLSASVPGLAVVVFTAAGRAAAPASMEAVSGDDQEGEPGSALPTPLSVRVRDEYGNPVPFEQVVFAITAGGGTIPANAVTDSAGLATSGFWVLGSAQGVQSVSVSAGVAHTTMTATLGVCPSTSITTGTPIDGVLAPGDCVLSGGLADRYALATPTPHAIAVSLTSSAFAPRLTVAAATGMPLASSQRVGPGVRYCVFDTAPFDGCHSASTSTPASPITLLAAPGTQLVTVRSSDPQGAGAYSVAAVETSSDVGGCRTVFLERGVTTTQVLESSDCVVSFVNGPQYYSDDILVYIPGGETLHIVMLSSAFRTWLDIFSPEGQYRGGCVDTGPEGCTITFSAGGYYLLAPSSFEIRASGPYTLTID